ncbi:efflux RND transporter periplasmic adaptor subunit [Streptococcus jiangjianxini]|uniref:efflux RND transporter periplasmic adaptor subunit n=1 Tax=Streptococcus jiangjianxini TaxID=3161189 RepID=UPI0032ED4596
MVRHAKSLDLKKKVWIGLGGLALLIGSFSVYQMATSRHNAKKETRYKTSTVTSGKIASSTLLSGKVSAISEQYVYYDNSKGSSATVTVEVGQQIGKGQQLVQYDATSAQASYDTAVRHLNKVGRQINTLQTYGTQAVVPADTGNEQDMGSSDSATSQATPASSATGQTYNQQLQDLYDAYADAESEVAKAQEALNQTVVLSDVDGTVVEVNDSIDPSAKESQTLVHVATQGELQVKGKLTEYDLANLKKGDEVVIKSKVYPDKKWQGKISSISDYPEQATGTGDASNAGSSGAKYEYKADITSDLEALKQGFTVSVEVVNNKESLLVPTSAVVHSKGKDYVWRYDKLTKKTSRQTVETGRADAKAQEILSGLAKDDRIIDNPSKALKEGQKISDDKIILDKAPKSNSKGK